MAYGYGLIMPTPLKPEWDINVPYTQQITPIYQSIGDYTTPYTNPYGRGWQSQTSDYIQSNLADVNNYATSLGTRVMNGVKDFGKEYSNAWGQASASTKLDTIGNLVGNIGSLWQGWQQSKLAKKALNHQMDVFNKSYDAQRKLTNSRLEDRQRARVGANSSAYQSVDSYMNQYGIK